MSLRKNGNDVRNKFQDCKISPSKCKNHGVTQKEIAAVITHVAFYAGWPKAWAVFNLAKEVWEAD